MEALANISNGCNIFGQPTLAAFSIALIVHDQIIIVCSAPNEVVYGLAPNLRQRLIVQFSLWLRAKCWWWQPCCIRASWSDWNVIGVLEGTIGWLRFGKCRRKYRTLVVV